MIEQTIQTAGVAWCINCCSYHPDEFPTRKDMFERMAAPQQVVARQLKRLGGKMKMYANKSCSLCGRTYKSDGELDQTWELTAKRVKLELDYAGVLGVSDSSIKEIVAQCRKSVNKLFELIPQLQYQITVQGKNSEKDLMPFVQMTFSGQLALIITAAQDSRSMRLANSSSKKLN